MTTPTLFDLADINTDPLFDVAQAAAYLHTSERFPRRLIAERRIAFVKVGRHVRIRRSVLDAWLNAQTVEPVTYRGRAC